MNLKKNISNSITCGLDNCNITTHNEKGYFEFLKEAKQDQRNYWKSIDKSDIIIDDSDYSLMFISF